MTPKSQNIGAGSWELGEKSNPKAEETKSEMDKVGGVGQGGANQQESAEKGNPKADEPDLDSETRAEPRDK
jgi:hypothetical protein